MREQSTHFDYELLKQVKGAICANCGTDCGQEIIFHHIIPLVIGGQDVITNIVPLCSTCHDLLHSVSKDNTISHSELIKKGIQQAREQGVQIGRPKLTQAPEWFITDVFPLYQQGITIMELSKKFSMSRTTIYKYLKMLNTPI